MHIEVLVEDSSGARLMAHLLPKLLGAEGDAHTWRIHPYKGVGRIPKGMSTAADARKKTLLDKLPMLLEGYGRTPGYDAVFVLVDTDNWDVPTFTQELKNMLADCQHPPKTRFGLATEEIEAWYLGDRQALIRAYPKINLKVLKTYKQDSVCGTWEVLADALVKGGATAVKAAGWQRAGELKHEWADRVGPLMTPANNQSPSFCVARDALCDIADREPPFMTTL